MDTENVKAEPPKELYSALSKAQAQVKAAGKSGENNFDHYKYAVLEDYWKEAQIAFKENGLALVCSTTNIIRLEDRKTARGNIERAVQLELTGTLTHTSGEFIKVVSHGEGQDRSDKSIYKAHTGARKYLLASILGIPTSDDPEKDSDAEREGAERPPQKKAPQKGNDKIGKEEHSQLMEQFKNHEIRPDEWKKYSEKEYGGKTAKDLTKQEFARLLITLKQDPKLVDPEAIPF